MMRFLTIIILTLGCALSARAEDAVLSKFVKASLVFHDDSDATHHYPHTLKVFLRLDNTYDSDTVTWVADTAHGIEAELLDADHKPVPTPPTAASVLSGPAAHCLPFGSRLDWLISHGGLSMMGDLNNSYALIVGGRGWLIPIRTAGTYTLRVRLRGVPWARSTERTDARAVKLLLDLAPAKLEVTP